MLKALIIIVGLVHTMIMVTCMKCRMDHYLIIIKKTWAQQVISKVLPFLLYKTCWMLRNQHLRGWEILLKLVTHSLLWHVHNLWILRAVWGTPTRIHLNTDFIRRVTRWHIAPRISKPILVKTSIPTCEGIVKSVLCAPSGIWQIKYKSYSWRKSIKWRWSAVLVNL